MEGGEKNTKPSSLPLLVFCALKSYSLYSLHVLLVKPPLNAPLTPDVSHLFLTLVSCHEKNYLREGCSDSLLFIFTDVTLVFSSDL